jgi:hypothetical protein
MFASKCKLTKIKVPGGTHLYNRASMEVHMKVKKYTIPSKNYLLHPESMKVGSQFGDHGRKMVIVAIGEVYRDGKQEFVDIEAAETQNVPEVLG